LIFKSHRDFNIILLGPYFRTNNKYQFPAEESPDEEDEDKTKEGHPRKKMAAAPAAPDMPDLDFELPLPPQSSSGSSSEANGMIFRIQVYF
jgi:hypothetical protein